MTEQEYYLYSAERLQNLSNAMSNIEILLKSFLVIGGILLSAFIAWYMWRLLVKPMLRTYIKFKI